jgi:hypothetical protein
MRMSSEDLGPDMASVEAQAAMGRVADAIARNESFTEVEGFELLPEPVQQALRNMSDDERQAMAGTLRTFADNGFYVRLPGDFGTLGFM